jgi:flagellin
VLFDANTAGSSQGILDSARGTDGSITTGTGTSIMDIDISSLTDSDTDQATLQSYVNAVQKAFDEMTKAATGLGANQTRINLQTDFVSTLMDSITTGVSQLVDADMNEESTKLQALQVKQQLGVQALSIANQSSQNILSLFRG